MLKNLSNYTTIPQLTNGNLENIYSIKPRKKVHNYRLVVFDMDSTLIQTEVINELAKVAGVGEKVAAITESAMRGEIDFNTSLQQRVKLLKGLDSSALESVYQERLTLNAGAERLMASLKAMGIKTALVSGGFGYFTDRLKDRLNLDFTLSNVLEEKGGQLTGNVTGTIVNGEVKARFLSELAEQLGVSLSQTIAVGDGANDLLMMGQSGLGVAYRAKPKVQQEADVVLNHSGLDAILHFLSNGNS